MKVQLENSPEDTERCTALDLDLPKQGQKHYAEIKEFFWTIIT